MSQILGNSQLRRDKYRVLWAVTFMVVLLLTEQKCTVLTLTSSELEVAPKA